MPVDRYKNGRPRKNAPRQPSNRTDLLTPSAPAQPVMVPTGGPYGSAQQLTRTQQSAPLPQAAPPGQPPPDLMSLAGNAPGAAAQPLTRPTERPGEPVTAGAAAGRGPGPETLPTFAQPALSPDQNLEATIAGLYQTDPNPDLLRLLLQVRSRNPQVF